MDYSSFLVRARAVHTIPYEYPVWSTDKVLRDRIEVVCPQHGPFSQVINNHLNNRTGCKLCTRIKPPVSKPQPLSEVLARIAVVHGDRYQYPHIEQEYKGIKTTTITVICPEHGEVKQLLQLHLKSCGCPECGRAGGRARNSRKLNPQKFIQRARALYGDTYSYPKLQQELVDNKSLVTAVCPEHGVFTTYYSLHILAGVGCRFCGRERIRRTNTDELAEVIEKARACHKGFYTYPEDQTGYTNTRSKLRIICPEHGEFRQAASSHIRGSGCPDCYLERQPSVRSMDLACVLKIATIIHDGRYQYPEIQPQYQNQRSLLKVVCPEHGEFQQAAYSHLSGGGCSRCVVRISKGEQELADFCRSLGLKVDRGREQALPGLGRNEVDILIHDHKIGIEYNGLFWHSENNPRVDRRTHVKKTELLESLGYRLIHVFEDEWRTKRRLVENRLRAIFGRYTAKVFARNTRVGELDWPEAEDFLRQRHLQGSGPSPHASIGLRCGDRLVAVATFGRPRFDKSADWELLRFASEGQVVGGMGKILKLFIRDFAQSGQCLVTYADRRWSQGDLYRRLGFSFLGVTAPSYFYVSVNKRHSRLRFQKHKLAQLFGDNFNPEESEAENCARNGYFRVFDCGTSKWGMQI